MQRNRARKAQRKENPRDEYTTKTDKNKLGLLHLAEELVNVSRACQVMGYSRDTFYRYKELVAEDGMDALIERTRRKPNRKNRVSEEIESRVVDYAISQPAREQ